MGIVETQVAVEDLRVGMYVSRLDRPWEETKFPLQGKLIRTEQDIARLAACCRHVYVDRYRSTPEVQATAPHSGDFSGGQTTTGIPVVDPAQRLRALTGREPEPYPERSEFTREYRVARAAHARLSVQLKYLVRELGQQHEVCYEDLEVVVTPMVDSIVRNPDAFTWLTRLRAKQDYSYYHAVNTAIWAIAFGRHLGLPREDLDVLGLGGLLLDVGKLRCPGHLLDKPGRFDAEEFRIIQRHVDHSVDIVSGIAGIPPEVLSMVQTHHERHDGSGYSQGLKGTQIPLFGRIGGLVDCYEAITSQRPYASAVSPHEAVNRLYAWRGREFQEELIEQFIQVIGVYPVGTLVELSSGQVGVVIAQHRTRRLRPKVMLLLDRKKRMYANFDIVDLLHVERDSEGEPLAIVKTLEPGSYGLDPDELYL